MFGHRVVSVRRHGNKILVWCARGRCEFHSHGSIANGERVKKGKLIGF